MKWVWLCIILVSSSSFLIHFLKSLQLHLCDQITQTPEFSQIHALLHLNIWGSLQYDFNLFLYNSFCEKQFSIFKIWLCLHVTLCMLTSKSGGAPGVPRSGITSSREAPDVCTENQRQPLPRTANALNFWANFSRPRSISLFTIFLFLNQSNKRTWRTNLIVAEQLQVKSKLPFIAT